MTYTLGHDAAGRPVSISNEERSRHIHLVGASGSGKSKLIESMLRQDITNRRGLCLIDPHGTLADSVVEWCASRNMERYRRIHVIEPSDLGWSAGFNPLRLDGLIEPAARVDAMVRACAQVWGGENLSSTPLLKKCLRAVFYVLAINDLTLVEAVDLVSTEDVQSLRRTLTDALPDHVFAALWRDFNALPRRDFLEQFSSTNNRLIEFLASPVVRRMVGQRDNVLDLRRVMDDGEILIVNLVPRGALSAENARVIGTLLTSELFLLALARDEATAKRAPFTLYVDECYDFLTNDIERMLDQTRKFGLHAVLAHQRLGQLRTQSEAIYNGVMAGGQTKIVFGGLTDEDASIMALEIMRSSFDLERPKRVLDKPIVVDEVPYTLNSGSTTSSKTASSGSVETSGWTTVEAKSFGLSEQYDQDQEVLGSSRSVGASKGATDSGSASRSDSVSEGESTTSGWSQTLKPVRRVLPTAVYSLDEEAHLAIVKLRELPNRKAYLKRRGSPATLFSTTPIRKPFAWPAIVGDFVETARSQSAYVASADAADEEISTRHDTLTRVVVPAEGDDPFWR